MSEFCPSAVESESQTASDTCVDQATTVGQDQLLDWVPESIESVDEYGRTPLIAAASISSAPLVEELIRRGANVNASDNDERTALHYAIGRCHYIQAINCSNLSRTDRILSRTS